MPKQTHILVLVTHAEHRLTDYWYPSLMLNCAQTDTLVLVTRANCAQTDSNIIRIRHFFNGLQTGTLFQSG